jgi:hypothetical protein
VTRTAGGKRSDKTQRIVPDYYLATKPGSTFEQYQTMLLNERLRWYNIDIPTYLALGEAQGWLCKCCASPISAYSDGTAVDHDHKCCKWFDENGKQLRTCGRCIRGLLCTRCNLLEGQLTSDPERVRQLIQYLTKSGYADTSLWSDILRLISAVLP